MRDNLLIVYEDFDRATKQNEEYIGKGSFPKLTTKNTSVTNWKYGINDIYRWISRLVSFSKSMIIKVFGLRLAKQDFFTFCIVSLRRPNTSLIVYELHRNTM